MIAPRIGLVGLGMMGRHHARVLTQMHAERKVEFVAAVDPFGDRHAALRGTPLLDSTQSLAELGIDGVVLAVPTEDHEAAALFFADAGVHVLVEKPVAATEEGATRMVERFASSGLIGAVGHIERYNPSLLAMVDRLNAGQVGRVISISTERVGPFPDRIKDVGVAKDLATHDIDIISWIGGADFATVSGETAHKMGRPHEDLVVATGRLENDIVVSFSVNWITPTKRREVRVLGERGALVADLLAADLYYYSNAHVPAGWDQMAQLRGVSEGDMVRYAIAKREPLLVELEQFCAAVTGDDSASIVTFREGLGAIRVAEALAPSRAGVQ